VKWKKLISLAKDKLIDHLQRRAERKADKAYAKMLKKMEKESDDWRNR